jgi:hypothetical protein
MNNALSFTLAHHHIKMYRFFGLREYFFQFVAAPILADVISFL